MTQLGLFVTPEVKRAERKAAKRAAKPSIDQRFAEFFAKHPVVYGTLLQLAKERLARGDKRIGAKALWEELRVKLGKGELAYADFDPKYKLNNDFTALYARKLIQNHPELAAVIEIRKRKGEK